MDINTTEIKKHFDYFLGSVETNRDHPVLYVISGGNGAGKSTLRALLFKENKLPKNALHHDPDSVMLRLSGYQNDLGKPPWNLQNLKNAFDKWEKPARILAERILQQSIKQKSHIIYERSCGMPDSLEFISSLVNSGYQLNYYLVHTDTDISLDRAKKRSSKEGRFTPPEIIKKRTRQLQKLCPEYLKLSTTVQIYDNTNDTPQLVYEKSPSKGEKIYNSARYRRILGLS